MTPECEVCKTSLRYNVWLREWYCPKCNVKREQLKTGAGPESTRKG